MIIMSFKEVVFSICLLSTECHKAVGTVLTLFNSWGVGGDITPHSSSGVSSSSLLLPKMQPLVPLVSVFLLCSCLSLVRISAYVFGFLVQRWARDLRSSSLALSKPMPWAGRSSHCVCSRYPGFLTVHWELSYKTQFPPPLLHVLSLGVAPQHTHWFDALPLRRPAWSSWCAYGFTHLSS